MVVARAFASVDMGPDGTSYLPPVFPLTFVSVSAFRIEVLDPLGRLQRYSGFFNLIDISRGKYDSSVFSGYRQFAGGSASTALLYEVSGAALNGQVVVDFLRAGDGDGLLAELFKGSDQIEGSAQADSLLGFAGSDLITAGDAADLLSGGDGRDTLRGGQGDDLIRGGEAADQLFGDDGADFLNGNQGADSLDGGGDRDTLFGGQGDDWLNGGAGGDQLSGDLGDDFLNGNLGGDTVDGGVGNDTLRGGQGGDLIIGGDGDDQLFGDLGADTLTGNAGNDTLTGGQGADRFILSRDSDVIADFNAAEGDSIAILSSALPYSLLDSADGLQISRADLGTTTLRGITTASFNENTSIVLI